MLFRSLNPFFSPSISQRQPAGDVSLHLFNKSDGKDKQMGNVRPSSVCAAVLVLGFGFISR